MKKLSKLFHECAYEIKYDTAGNDVNYKFIEDGDILYIFFEGSSSTTDWVRNFLFPAIPYKDMNIEYKVHRGFLEAWKEVEDLVIAKITETEIKHPEGALEWLINGRVDYKYKKIVVVGYSHGGALAAFCHECVWYWRPDLRNDGLKGYGFEAPRIYADYCVKEELKERWKDFTVIRTNNDIVTHCPPWLLCFCHVGEILKIKGDTSLAPKKWYIPKCVKSHYPEVVYDALLKEENK